VIRSQDRKRIGTSQMTFLWSMLGVTLRDKVKSENVRERLETEHIVEQNEQFQTSRNIQNYKVYFGLYPSSGIYKTKNHNFSETGSVSVLRWMGQDRPTQSRV
jgi:hypothetical protein